eukprot:scaffold87983_cov75-Phaeocystis_antarctica.AAC.6
MNCHRIDSKDCLTHRRTSRTCRPGPARVAVGDQHGGGGAYSEAALGSSLVASLSGASTARRRQGSSSGSTASVATTHAPTSAQFIHCVRAPPGVPNPGSNGISRKTPAGRFWSSVRLVVVRPSATG